MRLKTESETGERRYGRVRLARLARVRLLRHALPISLLTLRKKPTVLQSILNWKKKQWNFTLWHIYFIYLALVWSQASTVFAVVVDCKTVRIFAYSRTREQSNKRSGTRLKTESERLERFARMRLLRHALAISLLILRKKPTVLQSIVKVARYHFLQINCSAARASGFSRVEGGGEDRKGGRGEASCPSTSVSFPNP